MAILASCLATVEKHRLARSRVYFFVGSSEVKYTPSSNINSLRSQRSFVYDIVGAQKHREDLGRYAVSFSRGETSEQRLNVPERLWRSQFPCFSINRDLIIWDSFFILCGPFAKRGISFSFEVTVLDSVRGYDISFVCRALRCAF